jgi:hypothetical protein
MAFMSANSYLGLALETSKGTAASGTFTYIPVSAPQVTPVLAWLRDEALRGSPVALYDQIPGVRHDEVDFKTYMYADSFPLLLISVLGPDVVTGSTIYTHTVALQNSASTGSQPASVTINSFDGGNAFQISGAQAQSLDVTFGADKAVEATIKYLGQPWTTPTPSNAPGTEALIPGWNTAITIGSTNQGGGTSPTANWTNIMDGNIKIDRKTAPIFTAGTQGPHTTFAGPCDVSGAFTVVVEASDPFSIGGSAYALYRSGSNIPMTLTFTDPADITSGTNHSVKYQMSDVQFHDVKRSVGKDYVELTVTFDAQANTTDAANGGYSPLKAIVKNATPSYVAS